MKIMCVTILDGQNVEQTLENTLKEFKKKNPTGRIDHVTAHHRSPSSTFAPGTTYTFFYVTE